MVKVMVEISGLSSLMEMGEKGNNQVDFIVCVLILRLA